MTVVQDQQHDTDHPVEFPRVLVGAEEEGPRHVQENQDDHQRGAPPGTPARTNSPSEDPLVIWVIEA